MAEPETPYEHSSAFRGIKSDLTEKLTGYLQKRLEVVEKDFPYGDRRKGAIESAGWAFLQNTAELFWKELLEPAPMSQQRRLQLLHRAIDEAYTELLGHGYGGYESVKEHRDWLKLQDPDRFF